MKKSNPPKVSSLASLLIPLILHVPTLWAREYEGYALRGHAGAGGVFEVGGENQASDAGYAIYISLEGAGLADTSLTSRHHHLLVGDARVMGSLAFGPSGSASNDTAFFELRFEGNLAMGIQAYRVVPFNLSLEDASYATGTTGEDYTALAGSTVYLPIELARSESDGRDVSRVLFLAVTAGARVNSELDQVPLAVQGKVRYLEEKVSAELRYLQALDSASGEKKVAGFISYRGIFTQDDEVGVSASKTWYSGSLRSEERGPELFFFYGMH